jgi:hypothetical protein
VAEEMKNLPRGVIPLKYECIAEEMKNQEGVVPFKYEHVRLKK